MEIVTRTIDCEIVSVVYQKELPSSAKLIIESANGEQLSLWHYCSKEEFSQKYSDPHKGRQRIRYYPGSKEIVFISTVPRLIIVV